MTYREYVKSLLDRRVEACKARAEKIYAKQGKRLNIDNPGARADRAFLERFAVGYGADVCCGDFIVGDSIGIDTRRTVLGVDFNFPGDALTFSQTSELDYIVTNYLEALPNTLNALNEWHRCLKEDGTLAMVCRNADAYEDPSGALKSRHRLHTFNKVTLSQYLHRAGFTSVDIEETEYQTLHVTAKKPIREAS